MRVYDFDFCSAVPNPKRLHIDIVEVFKEEKRMLAMGSQRVNLVSEERRFGERS